MLTPEQKKAKKEFKKNRKIKKWHRRARCRFLKNLLIWFVGFISSIGIVGGSLYLAVGVIPLNNFVGNDESIVKNEIANGSLLSLIQSIGTYTVGDVPVLNDAVLSLLEGLGLEDMITIDTDKISSIPFSSLSDGSFTDTLISAVSFDATFKGVSDKLGFSLGDFSNLEVFTTYQEVLPANRPTEADYTASDFDHNSFYYMVENGTPPVYAPAFKDNAYANGVNDSTTLYYPALNDVPIMSFFTQLSSALDRVEVKDLVNTLGGGTDSSTINKIIGDTTIGNIGTFDHNTILLNDILPESSNADLYKILKDATNKTDGTTITVGDLNGIDIDDLKLSTVVDEENTSNKDLYAILRDLTGKENSEMTVGDVKSIDINEVKLETVLDRYETDEDGNIKYDDNDDPIEKSIWNILTEAVNPSHVDGKIRIKDLGGDGFNINNVKLATVLEKPTTENGNKNQKLWDIITEAVGENPSIDELSSFDVNKVRLSSVIKDAHGNKVLEALLEDSDSTIGNIADKLNGLKLKEMYDINCFTTDTSCANDVSLQYYKTRITDASGKHDFYVRKDIYDSNPSAYSDYTFDFDDGTTNKTVYYISKTDSGVWLLLLYKAGDADENGKIDTDGKGNANTYTCKCLTLGSLTTVIGDADDCFMNATIKMLIDTGILEFNDSYIPIYDDSVKTVFDIAAGIA